jgi:proteasome assembly chaperone (PAC2) family protein
MEFLNNPKLKNPVLIAGWPGMGLVAYKSVSYLIETLKATPLAQFDLPDLYQIRGINVANGVVEDIEIPKGKAYFHRAEKKGRNLILFLGDEQPVAGKELIVSKEILQMASEFTCKEVFTFAAMVTGISHHAVPKVWGCTTQNSILEKMKAHDILPMIDGQISGLNGLLVGVASSFGMHASCLLGELPYYATQIAYYPATCAVLEKFSGLIGMDVELDSIRQQGKTTQIEIDTYIEHLKREAIKKKEDAQPSEEPVEPPKGDDDEDIMN